MPLKWASKSTLKFEISENGTMQRFSPCLTKFDRGPKWLAIPKKSSCRDYLSNGYLNIVLNFNLEKVKKSAFLKGGENILECLKSLHASLFIKWASEFMIKFKF